MDNKKPDGKYNNSYLPPSSIPDEPQNFQFSIIGTIQKQIYERLLGYRFIVKQFTDPVSKKVVDRMVKEKVFEPLVSEWGANRIITFIYQFVNEQTPFAHITGNTVIKLTNIFCKRVNGDMYINFEKYFPEEQRNVALWQTVVFTSGSICLLVLSRAIEGRESQMFYGTRKIGLSGAIPTQGGLQ